MDGSPQNGEKFKNTMAFFVFGFVGYAYMSGANFAAAEDVLARTTISTSIAFLCDNLPYFVCCLILPMFLDKVTPLLSVALIFILLTVGIVLLAVPTVLEAKLVGFCSISLLQSLNEAVLLSTTAFYEEITSNAFVAGCGFGIAFGLVYYTGMTTWFHVSTQYTLLGIAWMPLLHPLFYWLMDKKHEQASKASAHQDIPYRPLDSSSGLQEHQPLTLKDKGRLIWYNMPLALSIYAAAFAKAFLPQSVLTTVVFTNVTFTPRDHYLYYLLTVYMSEGIGRWYGLVAMSLKCRLPRYTKHTWILATLVVSLVTLLVCDSWFRFLHRFEIVIALSIVVGISTGLVIDFTFSAAYGEPKSPSRKFSRAFLTVPLSGAYVGAAFLGLYIEPLLKEHCVHVVGNVTHCLTRVVGS